MVTARSVWLRVLDLGGDGWGVGDKTDLLGVGAYELVFGPFRRRETAEGLKSVANAQTHLMLTGRDETEEIDVLEGAAGEIIRGDE